MKIRDRIPSLLPPERLKYYKALFSNQLSYEQTLKAHLQDLARSLACRGLRDIQLSHIRAWTSDGRISQVDAETLTEVIDDEMPATGQPSHFDIRLQLFDGLGYTQQELETVRPLAPAIEASRLFRSIFETRDLLTITAAVGAIELWYVPLAARLEDQYLSLGYSPFQVRTYELHKNADVKHSEIALDFVEKYATQNHQADIMDSIREGFRSVELYDDARYIAAMDRDSSFDSYLTRRAGR